MSRPVSEVSKSVDVLLSGLLGSVVVVVVVVVNR